MTIPSDYLAPHQTERLVMCPLGEEHLLPWVGFLRDEQATRFFPDYIRLQAESQAAEWMQRHQNRYATNRFGFLALHLADGTFIGQCGLLLQEVDGEFVLEIGYHVFPEHWGKGYATEAAVYFKEYARKHNLSTYIVSLIHPENLPSQAVAIRNGMVPWKESVWQNLKVIVFRVEI